MTKLNALLVTFLLFIGSSSIAQTVHEWYQDGIVIFQLKTTSNYSIPSKNKAVEIKNVDFLNAIQAKYGIYELTQLHPNDRDELLRNTYQIKFDEMDQVDDLIKYIASVPHIEYAERKELHKHFLTPNDLGANSSTGTGMWHLYKMNAQQAWDLSTGSANVVVAVTDNAILMTHQDLVNKLVPGYDAPTGGTNTNPCGSNDGNHGTHVSGTVGAETNNAIGVSSIGFNISVMPIKIGNCNGQLTHGYEGINWAANNGADVINMSWGGGGFSTYGQNVCNAAFNAGAILVAAAGNDGTSQQFYPAAYNNVIAVASTTTNDAKSGFSQYGPWISVSAPGSAIRSTWASSNSAYNRIQGTSMASPNVAGLVGLMKSHVPTASNADIINCLLSSAANIDGVNGSYIGQLGSGRIDAFAALQCIGLFNVANDAGIIAINEPTTVVCGGSFTPQLVLRNFGSNNLTSATIHYQWNGAPATLAWTGNLASGQTTLVNLPLQSGGAGNYTFSAYTSLPNGVTDENSGNDLSTVAFTLDPNGQFIDLTIVTDCYGDETTWTITDDLGTVIHSGGTYTNVTNGETHEYNLCLPEGCYDFNIFDSYGDGMNGSQWGGCGINGNYFLTNESGITLVQMTAPNGAFGYGTSHSFCVIAATVLNDAGISDIISPEGIVCASTVNPVVELRNYGSNPLTSATINYQTTGGVQVFNWTGNLASGQSTNVALPSIAVAQGLVTLTAYTTNPNGTADDNSANDQDQRAFNVLTGTGLPLPFTETFENSPFTNGTWTIDNPDGEVTWAIATIAGTAPGNKAAKMDFYNYAQAARRDGMISPKINLAGYSSVDMTFEHAYRRFDQTASDSLIIYVSTDCGLNYTRVFAAGENGTGTFATATTTNIAFTPANSNEWCMGTVGSDCFAVNLDAFIGQQVLIKFEGFNAGTVGNNLYIDNINITGVSSSAPPIPAFTESSQAVCEGATVNFTDQSTANITSWNWSFPGGTPATSTAQNPVVTYATAGTYNVTLEVTNPTGTEVITSTNHITVSGFPVVPVITQSGNVLSITNPGGGTIQWYLNGTSIPGAVGVNHTMTSSGNYTVAVTNAAGCSSTSSQFSGELDTSGLDENNVDIVYNLYPNPTSGSFVVELVGVSTSSINIRLLDVVGKEIQFHKVFITSETMELTFDLSEQADGIYYVVLETERGILNKKVVVQR